MPANEAQQLSPPLATVVEEHEKSNLAASAQKNRKTRKPVDPLSIQKDSRWIAGKKKTKTKKRSPKKGKTETFQLSAFQREEILKINRVDTEEEEEVDIL